MVVFDIPPGTGCQRPVNDHGVELGVSTVVIVARTIGGGNSVATESLAPA